MNNYPSDKLLSGPLPWEKSAMFCNTDGMSREWWKIQSLENGEIKATVSLKGPKLFRRLPKKTLNL